MLEAKRNDAEKERSGDAERRAETARPKAGIIEYWNDGGMGKSVMLNGRTTQKTACSWQISTTTRH